VRSMGMVTVARRYTFHGRHHLPQLAAPWNQPHEHLYTVEVEAGGPYERGVLVAIVVDTDRIDEAWAALGPPSSDGSLVADLDSLYGAERTTVEALATRWLSELVQKVPQVTAVTVWEDDERWGRAAR
jgi:6-pyruvoyl-tetrahydropterin synthase